MKTISFTDADIDIEVRGHDEAPLIRLFRHPGAAYGLPAEAHRTGRFDPPPGEKGLFAILYTGDNIAGAAIECRILRSSSLDEYSYSPKLAITYKVVRFKYREPALFIRVDGDIKRKLGIPAFTPDYSPFQRAARALFERYGKTVHGLSWESFHRGQPGRNYGFWHHRMDAIGLEPLQREEDCPELQRDAGWIQLLQDHPSISVMADEDPFAASPVLTTTPTAADSKPK